VTTAGRLGGLPFFVIVSIPRTLSEAKDTARDDPIRRPRRPVAPVARSARNVCRRAEIPAGTASRGRFFRPVSSRDGSA